MTASKEHPVGKVVVITGASGTIGSAVARQFALQGACLVLADREPSLELCGQLRSEGCTVLDVPTDVCSVESVRALAAAALEAFSRIDVLVNVAGVTSLGSAEQLSVEEWDRVLDVNLKGVFLCCQAVMPAMRSQRSGRIVNIGSIVAKTGGNARPWVDRAEQQRTGNVAYGVSKAGVHALTYFLAKELAADGVTVNAVAPGPIASEMTATFPPSLRAAIPVGRIGTGEDVSRAVTFLASDAAGFITGEVLDVNGGMFMD